MAAECKFRAYLHRSALMYNKLFKVLTSKFTGSGLGHHQAAHLVVIAKLHFHRVRKRGALDQASVRTDLHQPSLLVHADAVRRLQDLGELREAAVMTERRHAVVAECSVVQGVAVREHPAYNKNYQDGKMWIGRQLHSIMLDNGVRLLHSSAFESKSICCCIALLVYADKPISTVNLPCGIFRFFQQQVVICLGHSLSPG